MVQYELPALQSSPIFTKFLPIEEELNMYVSSEQGM